MPAWPCRGTTGGRSRLASSSATFLSLPAARAFSRSARPHARWRPRAWTTMSSARADFSGSDCAPRSSSTDADGLLDRADPALELLHPVARDLAGGVPAVGEVAEGLLGGVEVGDREQRLGLDEQRLLDLGVGGELRVQGRRWPRRGRRRRCPGRRGTASRARRRRPCGAGAGGLPLAHQVAVAAGGRAPVGRVGERLGLLGQALLDHAGALALLVLLGEVRLAAAGVGRARRSRTGCHSSSSEARSIRGSAFHSSSRSRSRLAPSRQSLPAASFSASATMLLLAALGLHDLLGRSALRASRWASITRAERVEPSREPGEVADRVGLDDLGARRS